MVLAIAIMMVASTTVANCQAVAGKALKVAKEAFKMSKELGISNSTYTKIGYAIKSIYDDIDKQRREQIVKSHAILQMVEHNDIVEKSKMDFKALKEELMPPTSRNIKVAESPKSPIVEKVEEYDFKIKSSYVYPESWVNELFSPIEQQGPLGLEIKVISQYANNKPAAKYGIKNLSYHHLLCNEYSKHLRMIGEFGSQNSNNFVTNFCCNKETSWSHLSLCDKMIEIGRKVASFMKMEPEYIFSFTKPFYF